MSDLKAPIPDSQEEGDMNPPSYDESIARTLSSDGTTLSPHLNQQFQFLIHQITATQNHNAQTRSLHLQQSLNLLTAQIDPFFASFSRSGLQKGTLYLIPVRSISPGAKLADLDIREKDEFMEVVEVTDGTGKGVELGYWRDEAMAKILASELQPRQNLIETPSAGKGEKVKDAVLSSAKNPKEGKSSWWSKKSNSPKPSASTLPAYQSTIEVADTKDQISSGKDGDVSKADVVMNVRADEVVFRSQNDFGLWSSERGYAVVMRFVVTLK